MKNAQNAAPSSAMKAVVITVHAAVGVIAVEDFEMSCTHLKKVYTVFKLSNQLIHEGKSHENKN